MRIEVVAASLELSDKLRASVERRLLGALSRFGSRVERVEVRFSDDANPLGGVDRCCRMRAWLRHHDSVRVKTLGGSAAIERAVVRLTRRVEWALLDGRSAND